MDFNFRHPVDDRISQKFGENGVNYYAQWGLKGHPGIDYACPTGTIAYAPERMEIVNFYKDASYGNTIIARTEPYKEDGKTYRVEMIFAHLKSFIDVSMGKWVEQGTPIAITDNTGKYTTGAHLHWGCRIIQKTLLGGWKVTDPNNGYNGYFNQLPMCDYKLNMASYEGKVVHSGVRHYIVREGIPYWIKDEIDMACGGWLFSEAETINQNLLNQFLGYVNEIDYDSHKTKEVKQLVGLLKDKPDRATKLYNNKF